MNNLSRQPLMALKAEGSQTGMQSNYFGAIMVALLCASWSECDVYKHARSLKEIVQQSLY